MQSAAAKRSEPSASGAQRLPTRTRLRGCRTRSCTERPRRRRFTAEYKLHILKEAGACRRPGELGALLRREGLYTSHSTTWRRQRDQGALVAWRRPRGRPKSNPLAVETAKLRQRAERAEAQLAKAQKVIDIQGKLSALLEAWLETKSAAPAALTKAHAR